ncbi:DNA-processing protein DprA [Planktothrix mougeotii]|nr:DNA-processing protein DprA [Planktothrix mougeotii]
MNHPILSPDTQGILLLCASFGQNRLSQPQPLTLTEYNLLVGWLQDNQMRPGDLLSSNINNKLQNLAIEKLDIQRIQALLERGVMLSLAVEKWTTQGLWIMGRGDSQYPKRLKQRLKQKAPAIIYGIGNIELLSSGGLAIVGSRDVTEQEIDYTQTIAKTCAEEGIQVISGGARGVDQISMLGILEAGGTAVGVLADSLIKTSVNGKYRNSIAEGRLTLISPYDPNAGFNTGNAMGRNKYIYALADYGLVVSSGYQTGGTWAGAKEALSKIKDVPVFVRMQDTVPEGNQQLIKQGAKPFPIIPASSLKGLLRTVLEAVNSEVEAIEVEPNQELEEKTQGSEHQVTETIPKVFPMSPKDIYEAVLPFILAHLHQPLDTKSIAERLEVRQAQMQDWLNRAVAEGKVKKTKKPVAYVINQQLTQLSLLPEME